MRATWLDGCMDYTEVFFCSESWGHCQGTAGTNYLGGMAPPPWSQGLCCGRWEVQVSVVTSEFRVFLWLSGLLLVSCKTKYGVHLDIAGTHLFTHRQTHTLTHARTHTHTHTHTHTQTHILCVCVCVCVCLSLFLSVWMARKGGKSNNDLHWQPCAPVRSRHQHWFVLWLLHVTCVFPCHQSLGLLLSKGWHGTFEHWQQSQLHAVWIAGGMRGWDSLVGKVSDWKVGCIADMHSVFLCDKGFFSQSWLSVHILFLFSYSLCVLKSVSMLKIPNTGSHSIVWTHKNTAPTGKDW